MCKDKLRGFTFDYFAIDEPEHKCSVCGRTMIWFVQTLLCPKCDWEQIWELVYDYDVQRGRIKNE